MNIAHILVVILVTILVYILLAAFTPSPIPLVGALIVLIYGLLGNVRVGR
jgi:hypothetical protein